MGYRCCVNCSTEQPKGCIVEERGTGEDTYTVHTIVSSEEAKAFERSRQMMRGASRARMVEFEEPEVNINTFEQEEEASASIQLMERDAQIAEVLEMDGFEEAYLQENVEDEDVDLFDVIAREACDAEVDDDPDA